MSRYTIPQEDSQYELVLGYDPPLSTFFAQIFDLTAPADENDCLYWIGDAPNAITTVEALQAALGDRATIPEALCDALRADQRNAQPPTPLQRHMVELLAARRNKPRQQRIFWLGDLDATLSIIPVTELLRLNGIDPARPYGRRRVEDLKATVYTQPPDRKDHTPWAPMK